MTDKLLSHKCLLNPLGTDLANEAKSDRACLFSKTAFSKLVILVYEHCKILRPSASV